jgi:hypothetical protein
MKKYFLLLVFITTSLSSIAQNVPPSNFQMLIESSDNIYKLYKGVLLVRLKSNQRKINALKKYGYEEQAKAVMFEQESKNKEIIHSFKNEFYFCDTYFFYSENSNSVRDKDFSTPIFLNENLEIDSTIELSSNEFLIAEFGNVKQDETPYVDNYAIRKDSSGVRLVPTFWGGPYVNFSALRLMTDKFVQLRRPFPRYVRTFEGIPFLKRSTSITVGLLNRKLFTYAFGKNLN